MLDEMYSLYGSFLTKADLEKLYNIADGSSGDTDKLIGYLFGLCLVPELIMTREWLPGLQKIIMATTNLDSHTGYLLTLMDRLRVLNGNNTLECPFNFSEPDAEFPHVQHALPWVKGLWQALQLHYDIFWPAKDDSSEDKLEESKFNERYICLQTIQGIADPEAYLAWLAIDRALTSEEEAKIMAATFSILYSAVCHMQEIGLSASPGNTL